MYSAYHINPNIKMKIMLVFVFVFANVIPNICIHIHIHITKSDQQDTVPLQKIVLNFFYYDLYIKENLWLFNSSIFLLVVFMSTSTLYWKGSEVNFLFQGLREAFQKNQLNMLKHRGLRPQTSAHTSLGFSLHAWNLLVWL